MSSTEPWPEDVVARALNLVGAPVDLHHKRFTTQWRRNGPPYAAAAPYEVDGYGWRCLGCGAFAREGDTYNDPGYRELSEARQSAQEHAERCRFLPKDDQQADTIRDQQPRRRWFSRRKE